MNKMSPHTTRQLVNRSLTTLLFVIFLTVPVSGKKISRTALVIGNSDYKTSPLQNPVNDASDMADALTRRGFQVVLLKNADRSQMRQAVREFEEKLGKDRGVGLFYYAGHGIQLQGKNYLVPIGADIKKEYEVPDETVQADAVLQAMDYANNDLNIIILDACRNNPFPKSSRSASRGLARMDTMGSGMLIAYATSPGSIALDGDGENGIYTKHLLKAIDTPGLSIEKVFKTVRQKVMQETNMNQTPWEESSLTGDFYFIAAEKAQINIHQSSSSDPEKQEELMFWQGISESEKSSDYEAYLYKYPQGVFAALARSRLEALNAFPVPGKDFADELESGSGKEQTATGIPGKIIGIWQHDYKENNKENYLRFVFKSMGRGNATGEESDGSWWKSPFRWSIQNKSLILKYRDNLEKYRVISFEDSSLVLVGIEGDSAGDTFSMRKLSHEQILAKRTTVQKKQLVGSWKESWEEDGGIGYQIFTFRSNGSMLETGKTPDESWSQESRWILKDDTLVILGDEPQKYMVVNATEDHLDLVDLSGEYRGEGGRFFRVETSN